MLDTDCAEKPSLVLALPASVQCSPFTYSFSLPQYVDDMQLTCVLYFVHLGVVAPLLPSRLRIQLFPQQFLHVAFSILL